MRLDKYLANAGVGTRSEVKNYIKKGFVKVNDKVIKDYSFKVQEEDKITCQDRIIDLVLTKVFMLNKPAGIVCATKDPKDKTVIDLFKDENIKGLFPIGRLDKDTEGLLFVTNDGKLAHNLTSPRKHVDKTYMAVLDKDISDDNMKELEQGIDIGDSKKTLPCKVIRKERGRYLITIHEGRYHQVKRMFKYFGVSVLYLNRISYGNIDMDKTLLLGEYRELTKEEINSLL